MIGLAARIRARLSMAPGVRAQAAEWRERYTALRVQFREQARRQREAQASLKAQSLRRARRMPSVETLRHMLPLRLPSARRRAARLSPAASAPLSPPAMARRVTIDGLAWWVPVLPSQSPASVERTIAKQRFPYLAIAQTRDVAVSGVMLDVGANVGRMAIPRVVLGDVTRAYCAEPDELNVQCLGANVSENGLDGLVMVDHVAISDRVGRVPLCRGKMSGSHRVIYGNGAPADAESVRCTTLDAWVAERSIDLTDVTFVKVDTQGSELHVLAGAAGVLDAPHIAWQIEVAPAHLRLAGSDPGVLYRLLAARFTHFIDLNPEAEGPRLRQTTDLADAVAYLDRQADAQTDLVVYRAGRSSGRPAG
jgi:FkbM family methyltransferase